MIQIRSDATDEVDIAAASAVCTLTIAVTHSREIVSTTSPIFIYTVIDLSLAFMDYDFNSAVQKQLDAAMPWVGLYIAAASAVYSLATAADVVNGLRQKKLWFPCKYSSLNAASLTLLAIVMKLPMDLNTVMFKTYADSAAKFKSLFFISTILANFMPSLGSMTDKELLANVAGLGILVITATVNVGIQIIQLRPFLKPGTVKVAIVIPLTLTTISLTILSILLLVSLAVTVSTMKRELNKMYEEKHKEILKEEEGVEVDDQRKHMMKYWVMAESCSPQFVMARTVVCTAAAILCWISYIILTCIQRINGPSINRLSESPYGIYTKCIARIQSIGIGIGVFVAILRWFITVKVKCTTTSSKRFSKEFKIEDYWIQTLKDWRSSSAGLHIRPNRFSKYHHHFKWCVLTLCIRIQIFIVLISKILVFSSVFMARSFLFGFSHVTRLVRQMDQTSDTELNLNRYVLLLEGEPELPPSYIKSMCSEADRMIQSGQRKQPSDLLNLLYKSVNFNRVGEFNSSKIPSLLSQDPPDCWTLTVVTLTCIAVGLPNTEPHKRKQLLRSVSEGISLTNIIQKAFDTRAQLKHITEVARITWIEVLFYFKWLDIDLNQAFLNCKSAKEVLQELSRKAEGVVMEFNKAERDPIMEDPTTCPVEVVSANSMYRICQTILLREVNGETNEELWERLSVMIADVLAACLTNLPYAIANMCHQNSIEIRERSVREAFFLLGKTEQVIELVRQHRRPSLELPKAAYLEEWKAFFQ